MEVRAADPACAHAQQYVIWARDGIRQLSGLQRLSGRFKHHRTHAYIMARYASGNILRYLDG